jgi:ABC-type amino acid transport substrate-binding protein
MNLVLKEKRGRCKMKKYSKVLSILTATVLVGSLLTACGSKGIKIGVTTGTTYEEKAKEFSKIEEVKLYKDDNLTLQELANKRLDGVITDRLVGLYGINKGNYKDLKLAGDFIFKETIAVAIRQEDDSLRQAINKALEDMISDGAYADISKKYFGRNILEGVKYEKTFPKDEPASDDSLERVKKAGKIKFAMSGGYPPFNYFTEDDVLTGFDVEIGQEVAKRLGVTYEPVTTDWSGILEGLRSGRFDGIFGSMGVTDERSKVIDFTDPYYYSGAQLIVREGSKIEGPEDLK